MAEGGSAGRTKASPPAKAPSPPKAPSRARASASRKPKAEADDRPAIVFIHGTRLTGAQWASQIAALGDDFRCFAPDLPGHGTAAGTPFTLGGAAEAVLQTIDEEAGGRAVLVGLSLGGYVAMEIASRWPERVAGLVLAGASAEPIGLRALPYRGLAWIFAEVDEAFLDRVNRWFFGARFPPEIADPILAAGFHFRGGATAVRSLVGERFRPRLARYPGRTLLVNGEFDVLFRLSGRSFEVAAAEARRVTLAGATHLSNLDRPRSFSTAIRRFVREVDGPLE
jgi:pimeloyl-ACP methyl ester carboxylesterase